MFKNSKSNDVTSIKGKEQRKFYQNYVISSKEEAFVILKFFIKSFYKEEVSGFLDEAICNLFTREDYFGKDKVDDSCCFLVTPEIDSVLDTWINYNDLFEVSSKEGLNFNEDEIVKSLYKKFIGFSDMETLYNRDYVLFKEAVSWYKDDLLFKKFWSLDSNK